MSYPTTPAYVQTCDGWEPRLREHPVFDWMFDYEEAFDWGDMKSGPSSAWHTDDYSFTKPNGETTTGGEPAWKALLEMYAPLTGHFHEPRWLVIWKTDTGYTMVGQATMYGNFPVPGEKTKKDLQGRLWDVSGPGAFHFEYVKDPTGPKGIKMKSQKIYVSGIGLALGMVKRGMVTADEILEKMA
jgi:hypothetical protein